MEWSSSSKRESDKGGSNGEVVNCLVDGCNADLRVCREYHRRHKVCEAHSKTPKVSIGGRELRFCQQCSRFQSLVEFDEGKRSCRKRLDSHNRRRRKPQAPPPPPPQNSGLQQGGLVSFGAPTSEQGVYSALVHSDGALSLLSTTEVEDFNLLPWGLQNTANSSAPSTHGSSSGGSHQTFTFMWD